MSRFTVHCGDALEELRKMPAGSAHCCVTSPPYWGLRDYGVEGQLGLEATPELYVEHLVEVFAEVRRVLRDDGTLWLNLGDSYANDGKWGGSSGGKHVSALHGGDSGIGRGRRFTGLKPKDLVGIPWMVAFALRADGWYLRSDIVWAKPNPMPESVTDRPTKAHEMLFLLAKAPRYFFDQEAVRELDNGSDHPRNILHEPEPSGGILPRHRGIRKADGRNGAGRNIRSVWTIPTAPFPEAHFATFPPALVGPCVKAGTSHTGVCLECGAPWERIVERGRGEAYREKAERNRGGRTDGFTTIGGGQKEWESYAPPRTTGWRPACDHSAEPVPATVLDPFTGAGTTGLVALQLGRRFVGVELSPDYAAMARERIGQADPEYMRKRERTYRQPEGPLFAEVVVDAT